MTATIVARWPKKARLGNSGDLGIDAQELRARQALEALTRWNAMPGFGRKVEKSESGISVEFLEGTITFSFAKQEWVAHLSLLRHG